MPLESSYDVHVGEIITIPILVHNDGVIEVTFYDGSKRPSDNLPLDTNYITFTTDINDHALVLHPPYSMLTKTVWLKAKVTASTNGYTSTKCFSVKIINDKPLFFGPYFVEVGVRDTSRVPLQETEV